MGNRYTRGNIVITDALVRMFAILDRGEATGAIGTFGAISNIYDDCEITGGRFFTSKFNSGGRQRTQFYSGTYGGGDFHGVCYGGEFHHGKSSKPFQYCAEYYMSETGRIMYD